MLIAPTSIHIERFTGCVSDQSILNNDCQFKNLTNTNMGESVLLSNT